MRSTILLLLATLTAQAFGADRQLKVIPTVEAFTALNAQSIQPGNVYFQLTAQPESFADWSKKSPTEYAFLALWDGYTEQMLLSRREKRPLPKN